MIIERSLNYNDKPKMIYDKNELNKYQSFLYKKVLFGLNIYKPHEIKTMHKAKKERIEKVHKRAQYILNIWKQELLIEITDRWLEKIFPCSPLVKELVTKFNYTNGNIVNKLSFKALGITKKQIINKLIIEGILPVRFYELKKAYIIPKPNIQRISVSVSKESV